MNWQNFDNGKSIGTKGSESGIIIEDIENINGARVTIEKDGTIAPYSVTLGIYGLMFHTHFTGTIEKAQLFATFAKQKIDQIFDHHNIAGPQRDVSWNDQLNILLEELSEQNENLPP